MLAKRLGGSIQGLVKRRWIVRVSSLGVFRGMGLGFRVYLGALGGTLNGDPCSLLGVIWVLAGYIGGQ